MHKKKLMIVFGTRPEAIKMAPLIKELETKASKFDCKVVVTAQHREMLDQVLEVFSIEPDYDLNVMRPNQTLSHVTSTVLVEMEMIIQMEKPDLILVHGDTTTSFSAALAAFYQKVPVAHVEAGLRTYDKDFPYPEEVNRQLIDRITDLYFPPTSETAENLLNENIQENKVKITGNTAIDSIRYTMSIPTDSNLLKMMKSDFKWILLTMHRRENHGEPMKNVFYAVKELIRKYEDLKFVIPMHMSPAVRAVIKAELAGFSDRIILTEPLGVVEFHHVISKSYIIMTDSGGLQEEAPALNKPVLVLRDVTERPEGVAAGTLKVIGTDSQRVVSEIESLLLDKSAYAKMAESLNPYGDGYASRIIVDHLMEYFNEMENQS